MGVVSKATILGWLEFASDDVINQVSNLLESFFHKAEGKIVKTISEADGYTTITFSDDTTQTFPKKEIIDILVANQSTGFIARKNVADLPAVGNADTAYLVLDDSVNLNNNGTWGWNGSAYYQAAKTAETLAREAGDLDLENRKADKTEIVPIKEKTDKLIHNDDEFIVVDGTGKAGFKANSQGANAKQYLLLDSNGNEVGKIDKALYDQIIAKLAESGTDNIIDNDTYKNAFIIIDALNKMGLKYDSDGFDVGKLSDHFKSLLPNTKSSIQLESTFEGDYIMHIVYGQSLAVGGNTISAENVYTAKMFTNGLSIAHSYTDVTEANDEAIQEARFGGITVMSASGGFNNSRMITKIINELIASENNKELESFNYNQFGLTAGASGGQWYQLTKWDEPRNNQWVDVQPNTMPTALAFGGNAEGRNYLNLVQAIYFANKFAKSQGKKLNVGTLSYIQGEASSDKENTVAQFKAKLNTLFDDISADVTAITGQSKPIQFLTYQNASFALYNEPTRPEWGGAPVYTEGVPLAHLEVAIDRADTHLGTPLYPYSPTIATTGDLIHLKSEGYAMMSFLLGIKAKRVINDENPLPTFYPVINKIESWQSGSDWFIHIPFDVPVKPLVFDVEGISGVNMRGHGLQTNYGFEILNNSDVDIITNVRLSNDNTVVITTNENPVGLDLTYALTGAMGGGNLRDSQGDTISTQFNTITYRCDNWCPFFRITI
jgi:hypothetical protein